jgi:glycosyltransferase involved in cell wall biosynthesis
LVAPTDSPDAQALRSYIAQLGLEEVFLFAGFRSDVPRVMAALDVYVTTSCDEGFSLSTAEAMAAGKPIVATRSGGPDELLRESQSGLLVPVGDTHAIAAAVESLRGDDALRRRLGVEARKYAIAHCGRAHMIARYRELYRSLIGPDPSDPLS